MKLKKKSLISLALVLVLSLSFASVAFASYRDVIQPERYIVHYVNDFTLEEIDCKIDYADGGQYITEYAPIFRGYDLISEEEQSFYLEPTAILKTTEFEVLDDEWERVTPCFKLEWKEDALQQNVVVVKKGKDYVIWTPSKINEDEQKAIYDSFSNKVNGMFGAKFKNCEFMWENGSKLKGVTIKDDYITFDEKCTWSMYAVGKFIPSSEVLMDVWTENEIFFYYRPIIKD